jgi:hypothetical protein
MSSLTEGAAFTGGLPALAKKMMHENLYSSIYSMGAGDAFQITCLDRGSNELDRMQPVFSGISDDMKNQYRKLYKDEKDRFFAAVDEFQKEYLKNM